MVSQEEIEEYYEMNYKNEKRGASLNINKQLLIDYQKFCLELSRKSKLKITASARIRLLMVMELLENKR
ncbi:hypothetical protein LCGC14_2176380 [marine sediment metagenome]|uniref:Uncharacterized protein n=1 Tax=marine sediment metagenome TaxID=412755 RepID=A0A0F9DNJ3_9ZZZZ